MARLPVLALLVAVALVGLSALGGWSGAAAQEATPAAEEFDLPEGVTFEPLGFGTAEELPAAPADLVLARLTFEPGAGFPAEEGDPLVALVYVESGALTFRVEAPMRVLRGTAVTVAMATPGATEQAPPEPEEVAAGTGFTLEAGDSAVLPPIAAVEARNVGTERAVVLAAIIAPPDEEAATPVP